MLSVNRPTSAAAPASHSTTTDAIKLPLAKKLVNVASAAPSSSLAPSHGQRPPLNASFGLNLARRPATRQVTAGDAQERARKANFRTFSTLYSTNAGAKAINAAMRGENSTLSITEVMEEIEKRSGSEEISSLKRAGTDIKTDMKLFADKDQLQLVADDIYMRADPSKISVEPVHRGQGMTPNGLKKLIALWKEGTPIQATHFLSCDKKLQVAKEFAGRCIEEKERPVLFQIWGYSNVGLRPHIAVVNESETFFTPKAEFLIKNIGFSPVTGNTVVHLKEIAPTKKAVPLPY
jgi:hypothetical protein